ncbi:IclR family transcriptional regulator [Candidatus Leptofilum sp.]|uniref:IclR family transcriptional regulator n=1 Tax=Candidatus Leptofilum sp. TaxID=3241576 RepID=UPI003B59CE42
MMKTKTQPYPGTQSVLRAMSLLKAFDDERPEWGLAELSREVGLNKTTTFRLLTALESEGMVARRPFADTYILGPEIVVLGGRALRSNDLRSLAKPELEQMAAISGETATLEIMSGDDAVLIIDEIIGNHLVGSSQSLGTRWPMFATSSGMALLAYLPEERVDAVLKRPLPSLTPKTVTDPTVIRQELIKTRQRGYSYLREWLEEGLIVVGAPLFNHDGQVIAAISLGGPAIRFPAEREPEMGQLVKQTAQHISEKLGWESD